MSLLTTNSKLEKSRAFGYLAAGLELAPGRMSGVELCPHRGDCYKTCIFHAGFGSMPSVRKARIDRARLWNKSPLEFRERLIGEIHAHREKALRLKLKPAVRLNVFSDIDWTVELGVFGDIFYRLPDVQFYDYTKDLKRWRDSIARRSWPPNYDLTFSCSEHNPLGSTAVQQLMVKYGGRVTCICRGERPSGGVDGDEHDLTFLQPRGSVLWLSAKGKAGSRNPKRSKFIP